MFKLKLIDRMIIYYESKFTRRFIGSYDTCQ